MSTIDSLLAQISEKYRSKIRSKNNAQKRLTKQLVKLSKLCLILKQENMDLKARNSLPEISKSSQLIIDKGLLKENAALFNKISQERNMNANLRRKNKILKQKLHSLNVGIDDSKSVSSESELSDISAVSTISDSPCKENHRPRLEITPVLVHEFSSADVTNSSDIVPDFLEEHKPNNALQEHGLDSLEKEGSLKEHPSNQHQRAAKQTIRNALFSSGSLKRQKTFIPPYKRKDDISPIPSHKRLTESVDLNLRKPDSKPNGKHYGTECECCTDYYSKTSNLIRSYGSPQKQRAQHKKRPATPPGFWDVDFPNTEQLESYKKK
jgi:hypothetical protein